MRSFLSFRCLVTANLLAAVLLAAAPIDASRAANLLIRQHGSYAELATLRRKNTGRKGLI